MEDKGLIIRMIDDSQYDAEKSHNGGCYRYAVAMQQQPDGKFLIWDETSCDFDACGTGEYDERWTAEEVIRQLLNFRREHRDQADKYYIEISAPQGEYIEYGC